MPDLFVVMSDEELIEALTFAKEKGAQNADIVENIQYSLIFNEENASNYCKDGNWFPHFSHYIRLKTSDNDEIGILLSSTIWNDYNINKLYSGLKENDLKINIIKDKWFDLESVKKFNEKNRLAAKISPINSPWTARDLDVVETALDTIEGINNAKIIKDANIKLIIFTYLRNMTPEPTINPIVTFRYPNVLHLDTQEGEYNVFAGETININDVKKLLISKDIEFLEEQYDSIVDSNLILYKPRNEEIWNKEKGIKLLWKHYKNYGRI